jgi:hypothetical protein
MKTLFFIVAVVLGTVNAQEIIIGDTPSGKILKRTDTWNTIGTMTSEQVLRLSGQQALGRTSLNSNSETKYLVEYTTEEKCYECLSTLAVYCTDGCPPQMKTVQHFEPFGSEKEALDFMNGEIFVLHDNSIFYQKMGKFVRLLKVTEVPVKEIKHVIEIPQPSKVVETTEYTTTKK